MLTDAELVALVLRTGSRDADAASIARMLLGQDDGLQGLAFATATSLALNAGVGPAKAASLVAAVELGRRISTRRLEPGCAVRSPADVHAHFFPALRDERQESFHAVLLDGRHRVLRACEITRGTLTASLVHPREVFRPALREAAAAVVLVHNHPSGDPAPSAEDCDVTRRLEGAGELLGVRVIDHVIVAERGHYSFREAGELGSSTS